MKIAITADVHFGHSDHLGRINPQTGLHTRLEDFLRNFDIIVDHALDPANEIELLVIAGDIYKARNPTNTQQAEFAKRLQRLSEQGREVLITVGNHDILVGEGQAHSLGVIKALDLPHINIVDEPSIFPFKHLKIGVMPYIYKQKLGVKTHQEALDYYKEEVARLKEEGATILIGHQSIAGAVMPSGLVDPEMSSEIILPHDIFDGLDFAAYGHIHEYQVVCKDPLVVYPGPIDRIDFSQADKLIGFLVYDTDEKTCQFGQLPAIDLYPVKVDLTTGLRDGEDLTAVIIAAFDMGRVPNAVVKLIYKIRETHLSTIDRSKIQKVLDQAKFCAGVKVDVVREHTSRDHEITESISSMDALRKYIDGRPDLQDIKEEFLEKAAEIVNLCDLNRE